MGLFKKLKKVHKKTIAHKLASKSLLGRALSKKKKGKGGGPGTSEEMQPAKAKTSLTLRPARQKMVDDAMRAARKPNTTQIGGPGQVSTTATPMPKLPMRPPGGGSQINAMNGGIKNPGPARAMQTGGGGQRARTGLGLIGRRIAGGGNGATPMSKPAGGGAGIPALKAGATSAGVGAGVTPAGIRLNRIAKGYNNR